MRPSAGAPLPQDPGVSIIINHWHFLVGGVGPPSARAVLPCTGGPVTLGPWLASMLKLIVNNLFLVMVAMTMFQGGRESLVREAIAMVDEVPECLCLNPKLGRPKQDRLSSWRGNGTSETCGLAMPAPSKSMQLNGCMAYGH